MTSGEGVRWKLAVCTECGKRRMMPEADSSCIPCGRDGRGAVLSAEDIRWVISYQGPEGFAKGAWMLASADKNAAMGLDMNTGRVTAHRWPAGEDMPVEETEDVIILAVCPATRKAELPRLLAAGAEGALSRGAAEELAAEVAVRAALGDGLERFWENVDVQLRERSKR